MGGESSVPRVKILEIEEVKIANAIKASNNVLAFASDQIERAEQMIKRANILLSKDEPVCTAETAQLELLTAKSTQVHQLHEMVGHPGSLYFTGIGPDSNSLMFEARKTPWECLFFSSWCTCL